MLLDGIYRINHSHNNKSGEVICDIERIDIPVLIASRTFTVNFVTNGGTLIDNNGLVREQCEYIEDAPIFENLTLSRPGYLFKGWYLEDTFTTMFSENGNDATMPSKNISLYAKWEALSYTINFDANEGELSTTSMTVLSDVKIGEMPVPTRTYYTFDGWFTEKEGGTQVTAETVLARTDNLQLYAHWTLNSFIVSFDPNGGTVDMNELRAYCGESLGELPTPTRDYYTFAGWYTSATDGTRIYGDEKYSVASDFTLYAHWIQNATSDWVLKLEIPEGAKIVDEKWTYTEREYTESSSSSLSGYTKYDTKRTGWGATQGPVYSNPTNGVRNVWSESYVTSSNYKTVYHYYRYAAQREGGYGSYQKTSSYPNYYQLDLDSPLEKTTSIDGHARYMWWYSSTNWVGMYECSPYTTNEWVSDNYGTRWYYQEPVYTYYYYRDVDKESTSEIIPTANINKVLHWVRYIPKDTNNYDGSDFYALILNKDSEKPVENNQGNLILGTENHSISQTWHFVGNDDGTYNIVSNLDGRAIDLDSFGSTDGTNIQVYTNSNNSAQRWYLQEYNGGYNLIPKCSPNGVMDLTSGSTEDGTNVQFYKFNGTSAQIFTIRKIENLEEYLSS